MSKDKELAQIAEQEARSVDHLDGFGWMTCPHTQDRCFNPDNECAWCGKSPEGRAYEERMVIEMENTYKEERTLIEKMVAAGTKTKATKAQILDALGIALQQLKDQDVCIDQDVLVITDLETKVVKLEETIEIARSAWKTEHDARLATEQALKKAPASSNKVPNSNTVLTKCPECGGDITPGMIKYCKSHNLKVSCLDCRRGNHTTHKAPAKTGTVCTACGKEVSAKVVDYCDRNLNGKILCIPCQKQNRRTKAQG